ncbi:MAG TPA: hypothetical protein VHN37_08295 [Actinomycetota bacterium]|nr:hypothetical protein [Actinomycetota bacterium]
MKKLVLLVTIAGALSVPAVAFAQDVRDPFVPLIQPSPVVTGDGTTVPTDPTVVVDPDPAPDPTDPLPGTGSETASWIGLGYVLVALGSGALLLSKVLRPSR